MPCAAVLLLVASVMQKQSVVGLAQLYVSANELPCGRAPDLPLHHQVVEWSVKSQFQSSSYGLENLNDEE